ncbi:MAG TPA: hypothetical protein ENJ90_02695 [Devosia sp.]|nr:hypothetical protein [Devosia sp.]
MNNRELRLSVISRVLKLSGSVLLFGALAACASSSPFSSSRRFSSPPEQLAPVANSDVQSSELPPLTGANPSGDPLLQGADGTSGATQFGFPVDGQVSQDPLLMPDGSPAQIAATNPDGSIVSVGSTGVPANAQSRDLSGGLSTQKLLGTWTVIAGADQCRVNLTQTLKSGTDRQRASAPSCSISTLAGLASWKLAGTQVQFFNESGQLIGALLQSGNRFIGTLAGGQGISMAG